MNAEIVPYDDLVRKRHPCRWPRPDDDAFRFNILPWILPMYCFAKNNLNILDNTEASGAEVEACEAETERGNRPL